MVYTLDDAKAIRLGGRTMVVPSPLEVQSAIASIPEGQSRTILDLRAALAEAAGAEVACPRATSIGWFLVAEAAEEERRAGVASVAPWWRVTRDRKPDPRLPGGAERHRALLGAEGVEI